MSSHAIAFLHGLWSFPLEQQCSSGRFVCCLDLTFVLKSRVGAFIDRFMKIVHIVGSGTTILIEDTICYICLLVRYETTFPTFIVFNVLKKYKIF